MDLTLDNGVRLVRWERWHSLFFNGGWWDKSHVILLMVRSKSGKLTQLREVGSFYPTIYKGFIHLNWCRISSINSMDLTWDNDVRWDSSFFLWGDDMGFGTRLCWLWAEFSPFFSSCSWRKGIKAQIKMLGSRNDNGPYWTHSNYKWSVFQ